MADERDELDVLIVTDRYNYLIVAGRPETFGAQELKEYATEGYSIKTVKFKDYKLMKWYWEKKEEQKIYS